MTSVPAPWTVGRIESLSAKCWEWYLAHSRPSFHIPCFDGPPPPGNTPRPSRLASVSFLLRAPAHLLCVPVVRSEGQVGPLPDCKHLGGWGCSPPIAPSPHPSYQTRALHIIDT